MSIRTTILGILLLAWGGPTLAKPPTLDHLFPAGGERGRPVEVAAGGSFDRWPVRCWTDGRGLAAEALPEKGKLSLKIAEDARPGIHWLRLHDDEGASPPRPFLVGTAREVAEAEPNDEPGKAQAVELPTAVVNGRLGKRGDVDCFSVSLRRGDVLVASVEANGRLGSPVDAQLQLVSAGGFVLGSSDDEHGLDPQVVFTAPEDGRYIARILGLPATPNQQIALAGGDAFIYRLTLTTGGFLDHAFPLSVSRDAPGEVEASGWNISEDARKIPVVVEGASETAEISHPSIANAAAIRIEPHASLAEAEPNPAGSPQPIPVPATVTGRIEPARDVDVYRFPGKKGQTLSLRVESRELGQPLDAVLRVTGAEGKVLAENDDASRRRRDAEIRFSPPSDGEFRVEVRDLNGRGGRRYVYRLSVLPPSPDFSLKLSEDRFRAKAGESAKIRVTVERRDGFDAPIEIRAVGLPEEVIASPATSEPRGDTAKAVTLSLSTKSGPWSGPFRVEGVPAKQGTGSPRTATLPALAGEESLEEAWLTFVKP